MWSSSLNNSANLDGGFVDTNRKNDENAINLQKAPTIVPLMIKHLLSVASTEDPLVWGIPARIFTIIGIIRNIDETATKISYDIEDETGTIVVLKWLEADKRSSDRFMQINTYVRVTGLLREQTDKRHVLILRMWPIQSLNELTNHILEVTYVTLKAEAMSKQSNEVGNGNRDVTTGNAGQVNDYSECGMTGEQSLVYKIIQEHNDTEAGIQRSEIKEKVPKTVLPRVEDILDFLVSEGHIYTTSTDDYFKTT